MVMVCVCFVCVFCVCFVCVVLCVVCVCVCVGVCLCVRVCVCVVCVCVCVCVKNNLTRVSNRTRYSEFLPQTMEVMQDGSELVFLYQLIDGSTNYSYACKIAANEGLPADIVKRGTQVDASCLL